MEPPLLADPAGRLIALASSREGRTLVALAGLPGSGKTVLARMLEAEANERTGEPCVRALGMDGFHMTRGELAALPDAAGALRRRGAPWTFDPGGLQRSLQALIDGYGVRECGWPTFDHRVGDPVADGMLVSPEVPVVLVEGLYVAGVDAAALADDPDAPAGPAGVATAWTGVAEAFHERWFLDTPEAVAQERLAKRHCEAWGLSRREALARIEANDGRNARLVSPRRGSADLLIHG